MASRCLPGGFQMTEVGTADLGPVAHDDRLVGKIMARRKDELARRSRLLNPRNRFGVPHEVLDAQVAEKRRLQDEEAMQEAQYTEHNRLQEQVQNAIEDGKQQIMRERDRAAIEFSMTHLTKEQRREFALSDPNALRNEKPPGSDGTQLGISSMQAFEGEVGATKEAIEMKKRQQKQWLFEQMAEKDARAAAERDAQLQADHEMLLGNQIRGICEEQERQDRLQDKMEETRDNVQLAHDHRMRRMQKQQQENEEKQRHADNVRYGERMTESSDYKVGVDGRLLRTEYKRLSLEEEQDVYDTNAKLVLEKLARRDAEAREQADHADSVTYGVAVLGHIEQERARQMQERRRLMNEHNAGLAKTKRESGIRERQEYMSFNLNLP